MKSNKAKLLFSPVLCEECGKVFVQRVYAEFSYKPLCAECRTPRAAKEARREFNAAGRGWVEIVPAVSA